LDKLSDRGFSENLAHPWQTWLRGARPAPPECWAQHGLEKSTEQRSLTASHRNGNTPQRSTSMMKMMKLFESKSIQCAAK